LWGINLQFGGRQVLYPVSSLIQAALRQTKGRRWVFRGAVLNRCHNLISILKAAFHLRQRP
ncbi:MAG: hypothetical protein AAF653_04575, partial [Chloroflexota bacterium]